MMRKDYRVIIGMFILFLTGFGSIRITFKGNDAQVLGEKAPISIVTEVIDGDTIVVETAGSPETVRLIGIDTPELHHPQKELECFAREAAAKTEELVQAKHVTLRADGSQNDKDRYGRILRYVYLDDGTFVNETLVKEGYAYEYTYKAPYKFQQDFKDAQEFARVNGLGLWGGTCLDN